MMRAWRTGGTALLGVSLVVVGVVVPGRVDARRVAAVAVVSTATAVPSLLNGSFETGGTLLAPWIFRHDVAATLAVDATDSVDGGRAARVTIPAVPVSTPEFAVQLRQQGLALRAGATYTVSLWAKASVSRRIDARLQSAVAPFATLRAIPVALTTHWQRFELTYTSQTDVGNVFVGFNLAQAAGVVWLDHVAISESNVVVNGGFETDGAGLLPWVFRNEIGASLVRDTTVKSTGVAAARVSVPTIGVVPWQVQLRQPIAPLAAGRAYEVGFDVKGSRPRHANVRLQSAVAPFVTVAESNFAVDIGWRHLSFTWTPTVDVAGLFVGFNLAQDVGTVWIDNVTVGTATAGTINTVAGGGFALTGRATDADLAPGGLAADAAGNLYIASRAQVFKVTPAGVISLYAGTGVDGFSGDGGRAVDAMISPRALAVDAAGNLYIADQAHNRVRKVTAAGVISTFAGTGIAGFSGDGGPATAANLISPAGVAVDVAGNVYISVGLRVRKVSPSGVISTFAGNGTRSARDGGPAVDSGLVSPSAIAVDAFGNVYIVDAVVPPDGDPFGSRVAKVNRAGIISNFYNPDPTGADFGCPSVNWVAVDSAGNVYISEAGDSNAHITSAVRKFASDGTPLAGVASNSECSFPECRSLRCTGAFGSVTVDAHDNVFYGYIDARGGIVTKLTPGGISATFAGNSHPQFAGDGGPAGDATLNAPSAVTFDIAGNMYIADAGNFRARKVTRTGTISTVAGRDGQRTEPPQDGQANSVGLSGLTAIVAGADGSLYLGEGGIDFDPDIAAGILGASVTKVSPAGTLTVVAGNGDYGFAGDGGPATAAEIPILTGVTRDGAGNVYLGEYDFASNVRKVSPTGTITTIAGSSTIPSGFAGDGGPATNALLSTPKGLAIDSAGNLYIADSGNNRIRKVSSTGVITTVAGNGTTGVAGDGGPARQAALNDPSGLAFDALGNLYVTEGGDQPSITSRIRKISPTGIITTIAGTGTAGFAGDGGPATKATLSAPAGPPTPNGFGVAVDASGNVYVADTGNARIRKINAP
jgi:Carbohydrate binding domain/NHL repeat